MADRLHDSRVLSEYAYLNEARKGILDDITGALRNDAVNSCIAIGSPFMSPFIRKLLTALFALALAQPAVAAERNARAGTTGDVRPNRIVIQINEDDGRKWMAVLANLRNIQAELGVQNVAIAVVAIGPGLGMLTADSIAANDVQDALTTGVEFVACGNSMQAQHLEKDDLVAGVTVAKAGYVEIMRRQQQGWTYLRP